MNLGKLSIVPEWYVGFNSRYGESTPLAFFTPNGSDSKADKRKATVDKWRDLKIPARVIKSTPLIGYKIDSVAERYGSFGGGMDKWRITDPRGFQLEITSDNLLYLMSQANINGLEIDETCIWVRKGTNSLALIPTSSKIYTDLLSSTAKDKAAAAIPKVKPKAISFTSLKPGDKFTASTVYGGQAMYIGTFSAIAGKTCSIQTCYDSEVDLPSVKNGRYHVIKDRKEYNIVSSMNIKRVYPAASALQPADIAKHINRAVKFVDQDYSTKFKGIIALSDSKRDLALTLKTKSIPVSWFTDYIDHDTAIESVDIPVCQASFVKVGSSWKYVPHLYDEVNNFIAHVHDHKLLPGLGRTGGLLSALHSSIMMGSRIYQPANFKDVVGSIAFTPGEKIYLKEGTLPGGAYRPTVLDLLKTASDIIVLDIHAKGIVQGTDIEFNSNP